MYILLVDYITNIKLLQVFIRKKRGGNASLEIFGAQRSMRSAIGKLFGTLS